jgi:hypothetical protein
MPEIYPAGDTSFTRAEIENFTPQQHRFARLGLPVDFSRAEIERDTDAVKLSRALMQAEPQSWGEYLTSKLPFLGSTISTVRDLSVLGPVSRLQAGEADRHDYEKIAAYMRRLQDEGDRAGLAEFGDLVASIPGFATEFLVTSGAYSGTKKAVTKGLEKTVARAVKGGVKRAVAAKATSAVVSRAAGVAAQAAANPQLVARSITNRLMPQIGFGRNDADVIEVIIQENDEGLVRAVGLGTLDAMIELASERSGRLIGRPSFVKGLKGTLVRRFLQKPGNSVPGLQDLLRRAGWHGVIGEVFEERVGELARGVPIPGLGRVSQDFGAIGQLLMGDPEGSEQVVKETLAFSVPGASVYAANRLADLRKIRKKGYVAVGDGIPGKNRKERMANLIEQEKRLEQEVDQWAQEDKHASQVSEDQGVTPSPGEVGEGREADRGRNVREEGKDEAGEKGPGKGVAARSEGQVEEAAPQRVEGFRTKLRDPSGFIQRSMGTYIALDKPFQPDMGDVSDVAVTVDPSKILDPNGLIEGTNPEKSQEDQRRYMEEVKRRGAPPDLLTSENPWKPLAQQRTEILQEMGYEAEAGWIDGPEGGNRELVVFDRGRVEAQTEEAVPAKEQVTPTRDELRAAIEGARDRGLSVDDWLAEEAEGLGAIYGQDQLRLFWRRAESGRAPSVEESAPPPAPTQSIQSPPAPGTAAEPVVTPSKTEGAEAAPKRRAGPGGQVPTSAVPRGGKKPSTGEVVSAMSTAFGVPVRTGHFRARPGVREIYKELEEVVRIKGYGDIAATAHGVAHDIAKKTNLLNDLPKPLQEELAGLDYKPDRGDIHEGFAEYVRHRLTTDEAASLAPRFDGWFNDWLNANPAMMDAFTAARGTVDHWSGPGAVDRVKAQIHRGESVWKKVGRALAPKTVWDWIANNWINRIRPLLNEAKVMVGAGSVAELLEKMPTEVNYWAFAKANLTKASAKTRGWAFHGTRDAWNKKVGPGLEETFTPIADELQDQETLFDFYAYAYSRHALTLYEQYDQALQEWRDGGEKGPPPRLKFPGIQRTDAQVTVAEFDPKPGWRKAAEGLTSWHNDLIDYLVDAGGLSKDAAETMKAMYPNYISLARHIDSDFATAAGGGGRRYANLPRGVHRLKGSGRQTLPPLESALAYAERIIGLADKVRVSRMLVAASHKYNTLGDTVEKVDPKDVPHSARLRNLKRQLEDAGADLSQADMDALLTVFSQDFTGDAKDNILVLYEKGEPQLYYVRPDLYRALMAVDAPAKLPRIIDLTFGVVARAIRLGTTGLKPAFSLGTNPMRDIQTATGQTEYQPRNPFSIALNAAGGVVSEITGDEVAQMWEAGGGPMAQWLGQDRRFLKETVQDLLARSPKAKILNWMKHPVDTLRTLFSIPESGPRLGEYRAAITALGWRPGMELTPEQHIKGMIASANVSTDFTEGGWLAMWVNQIIPFFNAQIQGPNRMASAIRNHPVATISAALIWITMVDLFLWWKYKDEEWYKDLSPAEKSRYRHFRIPGTETVLRFPSPFEWGHIFGSMPVAAAQSAYDKDPKAFGEAAERFFEDLTPSVLPGLAEPPLEVAANWDWYFERPLVSERLAGLEPQDQYAPYTTETAKAIAAIIAKGQEAVGGEPRGISPIFVEHLASGWTGGLATSAAQAMESAAGVTGQKSRRDLLGGPSAWPIVGRFFLSPHHTRQFDDFYRRLEILEQKNASLKLRGEGNPSIGVLKFMRKQSGVLADLRNQSRRTLADESLTDDQKREAFIKIHQQMLQVARGANKQVD